MQIENLRRLAPVFKINGHCSSDVLEAIFRLGGEIASLAGAPAGTSVGKPVVFSEDSVDPACKLAWAAFSIRRAEILCLVILLRGLNTDPKIDDPG